MNEALMRGFVDLISTNTGLHVRAQDTENLGKTISDRVKLLKLLSAEDYYQLLSANTEKSDFFDETMREREWKELMRLLTTGESYFFRDKGQFALLRNKILPQVIESKNRVTNFKEGEKRSLRIWSAGCSSGEEPYSLAILLHELLPDIDDWNIFILGTDINGKAIEKAKQGIYSSWSFRLADSHLQREYFHQRKTEWELNDRIRRMVTFSYGNLVKDNYPSYSSDVRDMDLILCRNVFVYFEAKAISLVVKKFYNTLVLGGCLMTGHTELYGQDLDRFQVKVWPESVLYRRWDNRHFITDDSNKESRGDVTLQRESAVQQAMQQFALQRTAKSHNELTALPQLTLPSESIASKTPYLMSELTIEQTGSHSAQIADRDLVTLAEKLFHSKAYPEAIEQAEQAILLQPRNINAYYLLARSYANLGEHNKAIYYCDRAIELDSLSVLPYYILAHIAEEKGDPEKAKTFLKRIIYLSPSSVSAYLELGFLYRREGNTVRSKKMLATVVELLKELPRSATIEQHELQAGELLEHCIQLLQT